ncbi:MAG: hypothetical protein JO316_24620 [Abitibacteriaceae bacterium]|nr:hypothetical protein [Abditibacteriaceae bacterium]
MELPPNITLPFFAYGIFRPGQLAFHRVKDLVQETRTQRSIRGTLRLRDGLPIIDPTGHGEVQGDVLFFEPNAQADAYQRIVDIEPDKHYRWDVAISNGVQVNVLFGRSPRKGSIECEGQWDGKSDPLFTSALEVVEETLQSNAEFDWNLKPLFGLQMAYLLLWSSIERYVSLRYHLGSRVTHKVDLLAQEPSFAEALHTNVTRNRELVRADKPQEGKLKLDPNNPESSLKYYYQVRSNITHRGKAVVGDYEILKDSLSELLPTFRYVLSKGFEESN